MKLSIIIPTLNRYVDLQNTLDHLKQQSLSDFEIIIVDQTDNPQVIEGNSIKYLHISKKSASIARNVGLLNAAADVVLFLDDDIQIDNRNFLNEHLKHYKDNTVSGVVGAILSNNSGFESSLIKKAQNPNWGWMFFPVNYGQATTVPTGGSGNLSLRKAWAIEVGGMDERFEKGAFREETEFCLRYTQKFGALIYDPKAHLIHVGNLGGGSRSWELAGGIVHGYHHMFGGWYLMFRRLSVDIWPRYSYSMFRRFIAHKKLLIRIYLWPIAMVSFTWAFFSALYFSLKTPLLMDRTSTSKMSVE